MSYIQNHLKEVIYVSELAQMENMSLSAFKKNFCPNSWYSARRIYIAGENQEIKRTTASTRLPFTEIAFEYGFPQASILLRY